MKKWIIRTLAFALLLNCTAKSEIVYRKNFNLDVDKCVELSKLKAPADIELSNLTVNDLQLISDIKFPKNFQAKETLNYRMPKRSFLKICNTIGEEAKFRLIYKSADAIKINVR